MHILLTDVVTCPRCGPEFGLIVLADTMEDRHVVEGRLGCANCREAYPISGGVADLRWPRAAEAPAASPRVEPDAERPYRIAALLGITGPAAPVVVASDDPALVDEVQRHLPDAAVVGISSEAPRGGGGWGSGWLLSSGVLPFRSRSLGGVVIAGGGSLFGLDEGLRCLRRGARIVLDPARAGAAEELLREGAEVLLDQEQVAVASDPRAG